MAKASSETKKILPTFANDDKIPPLPVPTIEETTRKYLRSLIPIVSNDQYQKTSRIVQEFVKPDGEGERLQQKLLQRAKERKNWLEEWWLKYAYNTWRDPICVNISYFMAFDREILPVGQPQALQAARLIRGFLNFKKLLETEKIPAEYQRENPLCMNQYRYLFTTSRYPGPTEDSIRTVKPNNKITVICNRQLFILETEHEGRELSVRELNFQLDRILKISQSNSQPEFGMGVATGANRTDWFFAREELLKLDENNRKSLSEIEYSAFVVALDSKSPVSDDELSRNTLSGDANNRWFDKLLQILVFANGRASAQVEHTPLDASPVSEMMNWVLHRLPQEGGSKSMNLPEPKILEWRLNEIVRNFLRKSLENYTKLAENIEVTVLHFKGYGSNWVKQTKLPPGIIRDKFSDISSDSFFQMVLQLAYFRMHGKPCGTYETASTRQYHHGRTETCRSCSKESLNFTKSMVDKNASKEEKIESLKKAVEAHKSYMLDAVKGRGCDRHLFGLKLIAAEEMRECRRSKMPDLFTDPSFLESNTWKLSTSTIMTDTYAPGFSPVVEDGYGICYAPRENEVRMGITSFRSEKSTSAYRIKDEIVKAFQDMHELLNSSKL